MITHPQAARGHMPFAGHRTCAEWRPASPVDLFWSSLEEHGDVARAAQAAGKSLEWGERQIAAYSGDEAA